MSVNDDGDLAEQNDAGEQSLSSTLRLNRWIYRIADVLKRRRHVRKLALDAQPDLRFRKLFDAIQQSDVEDLRLSGFDLTEADECQEIFSLPKIKRLDLDNVRLRPFVFSDLRENTVLQSLSVRFHCDDNHGALHSLAWALPMNTTLLELDLDFDDEALSPMEDICRWLANSPQLTSFGYNGPYPEVSHTLVIRAVAANTRLHKLSLSPVASAMFPAIVDTLNTNSTLTSLYLSTFEDAPVDDGDIVDFFDCIASHPSLKSLDFEAFGCCDTEDAGAALIRAIESNTTLNDLYVNYRFKGLDELSLRRAINVNCTLTNVYVDGTR